MNIFTRLKKSLRFGPGKGELIQFSEKAADSISEEIATRAASWDFFGLSLYLPNPDPVLRKQGNSQTVYRDLLVDARIGAAVGSRKAGTLRRNWKIDQGESQGPVFELIQETFKALDIHRITSSILDAVYYGYSPQEIIWNPKTWTPVDIVGKPPEWFTFGVNNDLRFKSKSAPFVGVEVSPNQIICPVYNGSYKNPYGEPLAAKVFWPATFKKGSWRFWITFTEKYGMPWVIGKHPVGADQVMIDKMADNLENMVQDAIAVIPSGAEVDIKQSGTTANADIYERLITQANSEISTAILGHAGAGESTPGKLGNDTAGMEVREDLIDADVKLVESTFNQVIKIILSVNGITSPAPCFRIFEDEGIDISLAQRDEKLAPVLTASGFKFSRTYLINNYKLSDTDLEAIPAVIPAAPAPAFSEKAPESLEDQILKLAMFQEFGRSQEPIQDAIFAEILTAIKDQGKIEVPAPVVNVSPVFEVPAPVVYHEANPKKAWNFTRDEDGRIIGAIPGGE